ncbi:MAG: hypothetical protein LBD18_03735 [Treponema sp.]|jgi:hypothetical protein|nr:hypothetical protein [Treponema sp.]
MNIQINGKDADIRLEAEKTVGEILAGLESWLANTGYRLSGVELDGEAVSAGSIEESFRREIDSVETLNIKTSSMQELIAEGLFCALQDIDVYENTDFTEKQSFAEQWRESPEACLLAEQTPELHTWIIKTFSGEGPGLQGLRAIVEERLRELQDPSGEIGRAEPLIAEVCSRLEDLPLDIQTGKDSRAAETVNIFSNITEKVFRLCNVLKMEGFAVEEIRIDEISISEFLTEFSAALRELLAAYEQHDTVLVGDLAEYEMSPRLRGLYSALLCISKPPVAPA